MTFPLPKAYMSSADILSHPDWADTGVDLVVDIVPSGSAALTWGRMPVASYSDGNQSQFSHTGFTDDLKIITAQDLYRLQWEGKQFSIARIKDWNGFYVLDLDEVVGG